MKNSPFCQHGNFRPPHPAAGPQCIAGRRIDKLEEGLWMLSKKDTPFMGNLPSDMSAIDLMAEFARRLLEDDGT
mgnify:CR=1 FL=1